MLTPDPNRSLIDHVALLLDHLPNGIGHRRAELGTSFIRAHSFQDALLEILEGVSGILLEMVPQVILGPRPDIFLRVELRRRCWPTCQKTDAKLFADLLGGRGSQNLFAIQQDHDVSVLWERFLQKWTKLFLDETCPDICTEGRRNVKGNLLSSGGGETEKCLLLGFLPSLPWEPTLLGAPN